MVNEQSVKDQLQKYNDTKAYYTALGEFISLFSVVENIMQLLAIGLSGMDFKIGQAVFSGNKIDQSINYIRSIHAAKQEKIHDSLEKILVQVKILNTDRNTIVHHGVSVISDYYISTNARSAYTPDRVKGIFISPVALQNMTDDLQTIIMAAEAHLMRPKYGEETFQEILAESPPLSWRYKSQPLMNDYPKNRDATRT